jgi:hypothetical protein
MGELAVLNYESGHVESNLDLAVKAVQRGDIQALLTEVQGTHKIGSQSLSPEMISLTKCKVRGCLALLNHANGLRANNN